MPTRLFPPIIALTLALLSAPGFAQDGGGPPDPVAATATLGADVAWFVEDPALIAEGNQQERRALATNRVAIKGFDRKQAFDDLLAEAKRQNRIALWYVPRLTGRQMYRPAVLDLYMKATVFSDPTCVDLINRRFVPARLVCDPTLQERTGLVPPDVVEPALVFLAPDGEILRTVDGIRTFNMTWFADVMQSVLADHPEYSAPTAKAPAAGLDGVTERLRDGAWEVAAEDAARLAGSLEGEEQAQALLLGATALRNLGHLEEALTLLDATAEKLTQAGGRRPPALLQEISCERGRTLILLGRTAEARAAFEATRRGPRRPEALFHLGLLAWFDGDDQEAARNWSRAVSEAPESPWSRRSAANVAIGHDLTPLGPGAHGYEDPFLPVSAAAHADRTSWDHGVEAPRNVARAAVDYLLRTQRDHGGWTDSRYAYWSTPSLTPNAWMAATASSATALLRWRELEPERIDRALAKAETYLFDPRRHAPGENEEVYAQAFVLLYLTERYDQLKRAGEPTATVVARMNVVVDGLKRIQQAEGPGAGYWGHEYPNPFCTAAALDALRRAKARGARVPGPMLELAAGALVASRDPESGGFTYGAARPGSQPKVNPKDSMARSPICEAGILWAGHPDGSAERVAAAVDGFWEYYPRLEKIRLCDFHTDGELGGFFFWHGLYHTTSALEAVPQARRAADRRAMLERVLRYPEIDGSFVDSHEQGKSYGTAMGLLVLDAVLDESGP